MRHVMSDGDQVHLPITSFPPSGGGRRAALGRALSSSFTPSHIYQYGRHACSMCHVIDVHDPINLPITTFPASVDGQLPKRTDLTPRTTFFPPILIYQFVRRRFGLHIPAIYEKVRRRFATAFRGTATPSPHFTLFSLLPHLRQNPKIYTAALPILGAHCTPTAPIFRFLGSGALPLAAAKR